MKNNSIALIILILISIYNESYSQAYVNENEPIVSIKPDSLFANFVEPEIPKILLNGSGEYIDFFANHFEVLCHFVVDFNGKVDTIITTPIYGFGNDVPDSSVIWKEILKNIKDASKKWILKPICFKIKDEYSPELKEFYTKVNKGETNPVMRPSGGRQYHVVMLNIVLPYQGCNDPSFFYWINIQN